MIHGLNQYEPYKKKNICASSSNDQNIESEQTDLHMTKPRCVA